MRTTMCCSELTSPAAPRRICRPPERLPARRPTRRPVATPEVIRGAT